MTSRCALRTNSARRLAGGAAVAIGILAASIPVSTKRPHGSCFLLYEIGRGEVRREPSATCATRVAPQSTFKVPHALAALDAGVVENVNAVIEYDGHQVDFPAWGRDHTLASAMRYSVVWFFQEIAKRLGERREREYLERFAYGNRDTSGGLTRFWLGTSLEISPEEQLAFLRKLYADELHVKRPAMAALREILVQPPGTVMNAMGENPFAAPWSADAVVSAKTGSGPAGGDTVRWVVGHVKRGSRSWIFVSNVVGDATLPARAAIDQAERALIAERVLR